MTQYRSKERVERDGVLVYAEGDDIPDTDRDELVRQGYDPDDTSEAKSIRAAERIEQNGVLLYAEGDEIPADVAEKLGITAADDKPADKPRTTKKG